MRSSSTPSSQSSSLTATSLIERFLEVRRRTEGLASLLSPEDQQVQSMPDASPTKWHRAHTTWFFETFLLAPAGVLVFHERFGYLFNSYYDGVGPRHPRPQRGLLTRPDNATVTAWRSHVDDAVVSLLASADAPTIAQLRPIVLLGLAHEEQHQELIITDALHLLSHNPLLPALQPGSSSSGPSSSSSAAATVWSEHDGGLHQLGRDLAADDLVFDNEGPAHTVFLQPFALATRVVQVGALRAFIDADGYHTPSLWLAAGYDHVRRTGAEAPLYRHRRPDDGALMAFTVNGERRLADDEPLTHLSYYEADALARFLDARLPTEAEWEVGAGSVTDDAIARAGFAIDDGVVSDLRPSSSAASDFFGVCWQWTRSSYQAYPGFRPAEGVVGEYNGKFMVDQQVLRGSSSYTPRGHGRRTYRNFWPAGTSFQGTGLRLARDLP